MGTWGYSLYSNDTASDIRETYISFVKDKLSDEEAYEKTLEEYCELMGTDEEPLFWYTMADTMWNIGRLSTEVKNKAEFFISRKGGIEVWEEAGKSQKWIQTLESLNSKLSSPQPKRKRLHRVMNKGNFWSIGDVYAYRFSSEMSKEASISNKYILLQKIGEVSYSKGEYVYPRIVVFDRIFDSIPKITVVNDLRPLMISFYNPDIDIINSGCIVYQHDMYYKYLSFIYNSFRKKDHPGEQYTFLGTYPIIDLDHNLPRVYGENECTYPKLLEEDILRAYKKWHNVDYEEYFSFDNCVKRFRNGEFNLILNPSCRKLTLLVASEDPKDVELCEDLEKRRKRVRYFPISSLPKSNDPIDKDLLDRLLQRFRSLE